MGTTLHKVEEGHVGVSWWGGALLNYTADPGLHFVVPLIQTVAQVQVTVQTDSVRNIPCGTSGGVILEFDKVEVVNRLRKEDVLETVRNYTIHYDRTWIFEKIHHEINQFCSKHTLREVYIDKFDQLDENLALALQEGCRLWAPGIEIISVRVTKPRIPEQIRRNFEEMEAEKTKLLIAAERQKVVEKQTETERLVATIKAQQEADVSRITMNRIKAEKEAHQTIGEIENAIHLQRERTLADSQYYRTAKEAEANKARLTPEYLEYMHILSLANNTKIYFGERIPSMYVDRTSSSPSSSSSSSSQAITRE